MNNVNIDKDKVNNTTPSWVTPITDENIGKLKRQYYYEENKSKLVKYCGEDVEYILNEHKKQNSILFTATKELMKKAKDYNSAETLILMQNGTRRADYTSQYDYENVQFKLGMKKVLLDNGEETYTVLHNHPNNSNFSIQDVLTFIGYSKITQSILCTNSCQYTAILLKTNNYKSFEVNIITKIISFLISKDILDRHGSASRLIKLLYRFGVCYNELMHYADNIEGMDSSEN